MNVSDIKIPTWTTDEELGFLESFAKNCSHIVESGCFIGASARVMLRANPRLHLWTVDHFKAFEFNKQMAEIFLGEWIREGRCELIEGDMDKAGEMLVHMRGKIDGAFIDDGHHEEDVRRDIRNILPLLRPGAIMLGHDWEPYPHNDVARGVLSMIPYEKLTFPCRRIWAYVKP